MYVVVVFNSYGVREVVGPFASEDDAKYHMHQMSAAWSTNEPPEWGYAFELKEP